MDVTLVCDGMCASIMKDGWVDAVVVSCGSFGNFHLSDLLELPGVAVTALTTGNREKLRATGARLYPDHRAMFQREPDLGAVVVSIPPDPHGDLEVIASQRGMGASAS